MSIGQTLRGRYRIIQQIGEGGFGKTYLAEDKDLPGKPQCVVKLLKPPSTAPNALNTAKRLFDTEAKMLYELGRSHDQIPKLFAHFEENQEFYLVQEYIEGHDLTHEIQPGKPISETLVIQLLQDILEVLEFVHKQKVIHRDINPRNLRRRASDGKIVLIDFGAVKEVMTQMTHLQGQISPTICIGTPGYMPSEQEKGHPKLCSDIYAVGMVGIEALTGVFPHQLSHDPNTLEVVWKNRVSISPKLTDILEKMVRYDFNQRYQSATEVLQDLLPSPVPPPPLPSPNKLGLILIGLGVATTVFFFSFQLLNKQTQTTPTPAPTDPIVF
jgi:serine/threonine protein kinase